MNFDLTEEQKIVRQTAREFAQREIAPIVEALDAAGTYDRNVLQRMAELGFLGGTIPERYGGSGLDYISLALTCEEIERADTSFRALLSVHLALNSLTLLQWGTEEQKQRYLAPQARGEKLAAFALTETNAGSDAGAILTLARREGDSYLINGGKIWVTAATLADHFLVFATIDRRAGKKGLCAFLVERSFPGVSSSPLAGRLGLRTADIGELTLQNCRVPKENLLGEEGEGYKIALSALDHGRYTVAAGAVGLAQACLDSSLGFARERQAFGAPIGTFQLAQNMIAEMVAGISAARLLVWQAGDLKNRGLRATQQTSLAKWYACDVAARCADHAMAIHGSAGYTNEYPLERYLRNARGNLLTEGTPQIHTIIQAEYALGYRTDKPLRCPPPTL